MGTYDNGQLRGAYSAGYEAGVKAGAEAMQREGWKKWTTGDRIPRVGEVVKTLKPTMAGWIGLGRVIRVDPSGVEVSKLDQLTGDPEQDWSKTADLLIEEIAIRFTEEPNAGDKPPQVGLD